MTFVTVLTLLLWAITVGCAIAAGLALITALRLTSGGIRVEGRVVEHVEESEGSSVSAVVEYVVGGVSYRCQTNMTTAREKIPIGTPKSVLYVPGEPAKARVVTGRDLYVSTMALGIVAFMIGVLAAGLTYAGALG